MFKTKEYLSNPIPMYYMKAIIISKRYFRPKMEAQENKKVNKFCLVVIRIDVERLA